MLNGLIPAVALPVVASRTGIAAARLMGLTARSLSADEAQHAGLVDEVVDDPERRLAEWEKRWRLLDSGALKALKRWAHELGGLEGQLREASVRFDQQLRQPETRARLKRWVEGAAPWG